MLPSYAVSGTDIPDAAAVFSTELAYGWGPLPTPPARSVLAPRRIVIDVFALSATRSVIAMPVISATRIMIAKVVTSGTRYVVADSISHAICYAYRDSDPRTDESVP
eukprot:2909316-Rhodomonas_salina.1